jgi:glucokinase
MLLAGDVGGTKTLLGLFRPDRTRPVPAVVREYATPDFESLDEMVQVFIEETDAAGIRATCVGAAGPVSGLVARLTSTPFVADLGAVASRLGGVPATLLNDLEALAWGVAVLQDDELAVLQAGVATPTGNAALLAAGTGLGEAFMHNVNGRFVPSASEGGHGDFAPRNGREIALLEELLRIHGRVDVERLLSGPGLVNIFRFTHGSQDVTRACDEVGVHLDPGDLPAAITASAMAHRCEQCVEALEMFVEAYGSEAGNLALRALATAGIYIGGGIAPKILPALKDGAFMAAFRDKPPMSDLLRTVPVAVILNSSAALLGAAVRAGQLLKNPS